MPTQSIEVRLAKSQFDSQGLQRVQIGFESSEKWVQSKAIPTVVQYAEILAAPNNDGVITKDHLEIGYPHEKPLYSGPVSSVLPVYQNSRQVAVKIRSNLQSVYVFNAVYSAISLPVPSRIVTSIFNHVIGVEYEFMRFRADLRDYWVGRDAVLNVANEQLKDKSFFITSVYCYVDNLVIDRITLQLASKDYV
jgi:hypothetical protein